MREEGKPFDRIKRREPPNIATAKRRGCQNPRVPKTAVAKPREARRTTKLTIG